jgi:ActD protein
VNTAILGIYENETTLVTAIEQLKTKQIEIGEVFMPYPVGKVFEILGKKSNFPWATLFFSLLGLAFSYWYMYWATVVNYPLSYGGKPIHSIPSFIIVGFISMISLGVLLSVITFLVRSRLYPGKRQLCPHPRVMDDAFAIYIIKKDGMPGSKLKEIYSILKENGATEVLEKNIK